MKKINLWAALRTVAAASVAILAVSCDEPKTPEGEGPSDKLEIADIKDAKPGEPQSVTFKATAVWTISSDKQWCTPDKATGQAGDNTVSFTITDAEQVFDVNDVAKITIFYGTEPAASFTIERAAKERVMEFFAYDEENNPQPTDAMKFEWQEGRGAFRGKLGVKANFTWEIVSVPEWVDLENAIGNGGEAGAESPDVVWLDCIISKLTVAAMSGEIVFNDVDADKAVYKLKAEFAGTGEDFFYFDIAKFNVEFDGEGKVTEGGAEYFPATLYTAAGKEYAFIALARDRQWFVQPEYIADWVHVNPAPEGSTDGNYRVTVDGGGSEAREAWLILLPKATADKAVANPTILMNSEETELLAEYEGSWVATIKQSMKEPIKLLDGYLGGSEWSYSSMEETFMLDIPSFSEESVVYSFVVPGSKEEYPDGVFFEWGGEEAVDWVSVETVPAGAGEDSDTYEMKVLKNVTEQSRNGFFFVMGDGDMITSINIFQEPASAE